MKKNFTMKVVQDVPTGTSALQVADSQQGLSAASAVLADIHMVEYGVIHMGGGE